MVAVSFSSTPYDRWQKGSKMREFRHQLINIRLHVLYLVFLLKKSKSDYTSLLKERWDPNIELRMIKWKNTMTLPTLQLQRDKMETEKSPHIKNGQAMHNFWLDHSWCWRVILTVLLASQQKPHFLPLHLPLFLSLQSALSRVSLCSEHWRSTFAQNPRRPCNQTNKLNTFPSNSLAE